MDDSLSCTMSLWNQALMENFHQKGQNSTSFFTVTLVYLEQRNFVELSSVLKKELGSVLTKVIS